MVAVISVFTKPTEFGVVNEAKKSTKYFSERVNGGGFSRYLPSSARKESSVCSAFFVSEIPTDRFENAPLKVFFFSKNLMPKKFWNFGVSILKYPYTAS